MSNIGEKRNSSRVMQLTGTIRSIALASASLKKIG